MVDCLGLGSKECDKASMPVSDTGRRAATPVFYTRSDYINRSVEVYAGNGHCQNSDTSESNPDRGL